MDLNKFSNLIKDNKVDEADKLEAFNSFYSYYSDLVKKVLKNKTYTERQLSVDIFRKKWTEKKSETVFKKQLFSSFKTIERIKISLETGIVNHFNNASPQCYH